MLDNDSPVIPRREKTKIVFMNKNLCALRQPESDSQRTAVIVVLSSPDHFFARDLIRQSYGSIKSANNVTILGVVFMLGISRGQELDTRKTTKLQDEIDEFGDIVLGDFIDTYRNLTRKTIMAYEWVTSYCREAQMVVKTDDDVFVNIFQLTKELSSWPESDIFSTNIWCALHKNERTVKKRNSIYYASWLDFPSGEFPEHCAGVGYLTPMGVIDRIVDEISRSFPGRVSTHEDVFITGIVVEHINRHRTSIFNKPIKRVDRHIEWRSLDLQDSVYDTNKFLANLTEGNVANMKMSILKEFRRRYDTKIFYLLMHANNFSKRYLRLWHITIRSYLT